MKPLALMMCPLLLICGGSAWADAAAGRSTYAARGCIGCHGPGGVSAVAEYPSLKGRSGAFIRQSLTDFRGGARQSPVMSNMAAGLSDEDIDNIADYIESLD